MEFVDRPKLDDRAWVKFDGLEALSAFVCWVDGFVADLEFEIPMHPPVLTASLVVQNRNNDLPTNASNRLPTDSPAEHGPGPHEARHECGSA